MKKKNQNQTRCDRGGAKLDPIKMLDSTQNPNNTCTALDCDNLILGLDTSYSQVQSSNSSIK